MSLVFFSSSINPITYSHPSYGCLANGANLQKQIKHPFLLHPNSTFITGISSNTVLRKPYNLFKNFTAAKAVKTDEEEVMPFTEEENYVDFDWADEEDEGSPWEGAIVFRRKSSVSHVEYCTTLERLGLGKLSSELSRSRASTMGLRVTNEVKDYPHGTPVLVSVDVTRKKHKLRLDGIIRTVISLPCNRCGEPAAESVFSNFSLLLTEEPIEEPEVLNMGVIYGEEKSKTFTGNIDEEEDEDEASIDLDDRLHFPPEEKEIDISKHIRDIVHVEITMNAVCDPKCKGLCLKCGTNLNTSLCKCSKQEEEASSNSVFGDLRKQMQHK